MAIEITCEECFDTFAVRDQAAGKKVKCKQCGAVIVVPAKQQVHEADDDSEEAPRTVRRPASRKKGSQSGARGIPAWVWGLVGGGVAVLLLTAFLIMVRVSVKNDVSQAAAEAAKASSNPAAGPGSAPAAAGAAANIAWSVKPDPMTEKIEWPAVFKSAISVPDNFPTIAFPSRASRFVAVNLGQNVRGTPTVWDLIQGEKKGELKSATGDGEQFVLSPDGRYLIVTQNSFKNQLPALWSFETGGKVGLASDLTGTVLAAEFAGPDQALFWTKERKLFVVDAKTGAIQRRADTIEAEHSASLAVSPGSKYVALGGSKGRIQTFEVATGKPTGETVYPGDLNNWGVSNLAFSADGTRVASFVAELDKTTLLVSDAKTGRMDVAFSMPGNITNASAKTHSYKGPLLEWLDGDRGWLLYGMFIVDPKSKQIVWQFPYPDSEIIPTSRHVAGGSVMALGGPATSLQVKAFEVPWSKIEAALASFDPNDALFGTGTKVRMEVQVGALLNGGQPIPTKELIDTTVRKRLASQQIGVGEGDASLALVKIEYSEKAGPNMEFRAMGGRVTGAPATIVPTTIGIVQATIFTPDGAKSLFKYAVEASAPGFLMNVEPTAISLRDKMLERMKSQLESLPLPIFIPKDPNGMTVPGTTRVD